MIKLTSTTTFRAILLLLAITVFLDGMSTFIALSVGLREGNPIVNALGGPSASLLFRAVFIVLALYRCRTWDKPRRIAVLNVTHAVALMLTLFFAVQNLYATYYIVVLNG